jgi:hypothetical protein
MCGDFGSAFRRFASSIDDMIVMRSINSPWIAGRDFDAPTSV